MIQGIIILVLILFLMSPLGLPRIYNSISLFTFSQRFYAYPLPPETTVINRSSEYGVLRGNGNHCDFLATIVVTTTLTEKEMKDYYINVTFPAVQSDSSIAGSWGLNGRIPPRVQFISTTTAEISLYDGGYGSYGGFRGWDGKCH